MEQLDERVTLWINSHYCEFTDHIWMLFSDKEVWFLMYIIVAVMLFRRLGWKRGLLAFIAIVLTIVACDQLGNLVKDTVARLRPCYNRFMTENGLHRLEGRGSFYGFYSAHAANSAGFAVSSTRCFRWDRSRRYNAYAWGTGIWAFLVGTSRIFAGKHFLGDVLTGFAVGALIGYVMPEIGNRIWNHFTKNTKAVPTR